ISSPKVHFPMSPRPMVPPKARRWRNVWRTSRESSMNRKVNARRQSTDSRMIPSWIYLIFI
ncbi:hypothetical protein BC826DRAFT_998743, partial [Russula brevipes]